MKRAVSHIIIVIAAIAVFFTGVGVTIVQYCCTGCAEQVLNVGEEEHACCVPDHYTQKSATGCCMPVADVCDQFTDANHCNASRLTMDLNAFNIKPQIDNNFTYIPLNNTLFSLMPLAELCSNHCAHLASPPKVPPRDYLALFSILII